jgi:hypothetical protein
MALPKFTPTQQKIMDILQDGEPHKRSRLMECIPDELSSDTQLRHHMKLIRDRLRPYGQTVLCQFMNRGLYYRWVRILGNPNE